MDALVNTAAITPEDDVFPLSFAQARLWFLDQLEGLGPAYHVRLPVRLAGPLDVGALQQAVAAVVARHESLRTVFAVVHGEPVQVVRAHMPVPLEFIDMPQADEDSLRDKAAELASAPFDLQHGPLLRVYLLREAAERHQLLVVIHHIVADAWSSGVLFRDLMATYEGILRDQPPELPELPVQYADYAVWQRNWLSGPELERQLSFWRDALADAPALLPLPTDRPRPAAQSYRGSRWAHFVEPQLTAALKRLAQDESATLFMVLLAAFQVLLARYSGQTDVVVGSPVAGRRRSELEALVGFFANTLVLRAQCPAGLPFREFLAQVRASSLAAFAHQELPFERLVEALQPERQLSYSPVFQVMFVLQNTPWHEQTVSHLDIEPGVIAPVDAAKFDLTLSIAEHEDGLWANFEYNTDLFDAATVAGIAESFQALLHAIVNDVTRPIGELPLQPKTDLLAEQVPWNDTAADYPHKLSLAQFLTDQGARDVDQVAVRGDGMAWCYGELLRKAAAIGEQLRDAGAAQNVPVAICVERSPAMLAAVLGVLDSGAAYLPLDPAYPGERLRFMLADSGAALLLTDAPENFAEYPGTVIALNAQAEVTGVDARGAAPRPVAAPEALAYLIYTSGSTGQPKGVKVPQSAVVNFLHSMAREPGLASVDRLLAVTTLSFDISVLELLLPLSVGAEVVIAPAATATDAKALAELLDASGATVMQATPATWRMLLDSGWTGPSTPDRQLRILCGGEALDPDLARALLNAGAEVWNLYGPTETTIWSTCVRIFDAADGITVGRPIANTRVWVVDDALRPLPAGVPGELLIAGAGVTCGYHARDELTAAKFVELAATGERVYRTGDRARWRRDGQLELLGRTDGQVKLRGFRIELGEIEAALHAQPGVAAAAAGLRESPAGDARLVAWIAPAVAEVNPELLRAHLRQTLPDYMVPGEWVLVDALPLTPNGKVDRRALPAPDWAAAVAGGGAARTPVEGLVCELFAAVLGRRGVGVGGDFFALGGHSLLATQLVSRLRDALGVEVPLRAVFETPTPAGLAANLDADDLPASARELIPAADRADPFAPATFMQRRLWFLDRLQPGNPVYNLAWSAQLTGELDPDALQAAVDAMAERHASLRTVIEELDGEPRQRVCDTSPSIRWLTHRDVHSLQAFAEEPFDLARGPLWRVVVNATGERESVLLVVVHHIVADGWSMGVLFRDLAAAYNAARRGAVPELPALALQYTDYARWQRDELAGAELERQLAYWRRQLAGAPPALELPTDRPRPAVQSSRGARLSRRLDKPLLDACQALARDAGGTLFMVLAAALAAVLGRHAGSADVLLGTPIAGRGRTELEDLVGFFVNTLVLRVDLAGAPSFAELLARVRHTALDAYAHPDVPFEKLVEALDVPRDPARSPVFQVMFNLHNEPQQNVSWDGMNWQPVAVARQTAKFDLTVACSETRDGLMVNLEYNADLFNAASMQTLATDFETFLQFMTTDASRSLSDWHAVVEPPPALPRPELVSAPDVWSAFATVATGARKSLAVTAGTVRWSYGALAEFASRVAQDLAAAGVAPGDRVGLLAGHDAGAVAGLLGILQAGGAWVVLDDRDPEARQRAVLAAAGIEVLVCDTAHRGQAAALAVPAVVIDTRADGRVTAPVAVPLARDALACVLYTSGTTGSPKGVMQSHGGLLAQVGRYAASLALTATDRLSGLSGLGYDAAVQDVFGALLSGASLHLADLRDGRDADAQVESLAAAAVTVVHATPTVYRYLFGGELDCRHSLASVRRLVLGGEVARRSDFELFRSRFSAGAVLVNGYGLTECTVGLQWQGDADTVVRGEALPLGLPVGELAVRLVDESGAASWLGEIELAVGGLAAGYWGDAAQTAARYLADAQAPGGRWYRTGDWGWRRPDGSLGYLGRRDGQVQLRGRRLELGEVEAALAGCAGVQACAVALRDSAAGDAQLVAYVCTPTDLTPDTLRAELGRRLPAALVPTQWMLLEVLPRLANGKVDRRALPAPVRRAAAVEEPRSALERRLAGLWAELLGLETVAVHEDFFALGGHSLLATRLIARIRDQLGVEISLLSLFEFPTVAGIADVLDAMPRHDQAGHIPELSAIARIDNNKWPKRAAKGE